MEFKFTGFDMRAGLLSGREMLRGHVDMTQEIQRELEKEMIREEILAEEMARKRALEAEVWRELMIEREMMRGSEVFTSSFVPSYSNLFERRQPFAPEDRRIVMSSSEKLDDGGRRHREIEGFEAVPFQRLPRSPKVKEITSSTLEDGKKEVIHLGKTSGEAKGKWKCGVCEISITSEHDLNQHLAGRKHQANTGVAPKVFKNKKNSRKSVRNSSQKKETCRHKKTRKHLEVGC